MKFVEDNLAFITRDGKKLYSLMDLLIWLYSCSEEDFKYHVNDKGNHFYIWIKDTIKDLDLAEKIKNIKTKEEMISILKKKIFNSEFKIEKEKESEVLLDFIRRFIKG